MTDASQEVVVLALVDVAPASRLWGWSRIVLGAQALRNVPGLRFVKVLGSGHDGGFGLKPSASVQAVFAVFANEASADIFLGPDGPMLAWRSRAREYFTVKLKAFSSRGTWAGARLALSAEPPAHGPIASLTRASIRPLRAQAFWARQPAAEVSLAQASGCLLAAGVGEAPLLRQATFSVWENQQAMDDYARTGAHQRAIEAAAQGRFFAESMFVRFVPCGTQGRWKGYPGG